MVLSPRPSSRQSIHASTAVVLLSVSSTHVNDDQWYVLRPTRRPLQHAANWLHCFHLESGEFHIQIVTYCLLSTGTQYVQNIKINEDSFVNQFLIQSVQVLVGIISSLIVFPINLIVVQIFRNVRPKPKVKPKKPPPTPCLPTLSFDKDSLDNYNNLKESSDDSAKGSRNSLDFSREKNNKTRLSINDVHTDVDRTSFTDSPLLIDRRLSTTYDIGKETRWRLTKNFLFFLFIEELRQS